MESLDPLNYLVAVLREHEIPISRDDVQWALNAPRTKDTVVEWVKEYLGVDTLLSKEELELYDKLKENGTVRAIQASHDLSTIRPFLDDDIRNALKQLKASTSAIKKQTTTLRNQQEALRLYRESLEDGELRRKHVGEQRKRKYALEKQHLEQAADELMEGLTEQLASSQQQLQAANGNLTASVTATLKGDDRLLKKLQGLVRELKDVDHQLGDSIAERAKDLGTKLAGFMAEEIRCRLDRTFLQYESEDSEPSGVDSKEADDPEPFLVEDLNSLYSEVQAVAQMSVHQNLVQPATRQLVDEKETDEAHSKATLDYVTSTLATLTTRMHEVSTHIHNHHSHRMALKALSEALNDIATDEKFGDALSPSKQQAPAFPTVPYMPASSATLSVSPPVEDGMSPMDTQVSSQSLQQLLGHLGISTAGQDGTMSIDKSISAAIAQRAKIVSNQMSDLEASTLDLLSTPLGDSSSSFQLFRDAIYGDSPYGRFRFVDQGLEGKLDMLDDDLGGIKKDITRLDVEALHERDTKRDHFLEQWSN